MRQTNALSYLFSVLGYTYLFWVPAAVLSVDAGSLPGKILVALGGLGPAMIAMVFLLFREDGCVRSGYFRRLLFFPGFKKSWWLFILFAAPAISLSAAGISAVLGDSWGELIPGFGGRNIFLTLVFLLFFGPIPEELGWRGYGLERLLQSLETAPASVLLAVFWSLWHVPLFFLPGYPLAELAGDTVLLASYFLVLFPKSFLFTYLFKRTKGSIWAAVFFHFSINAAGTFIELGKTGALAETFLYFAAAAAAGLYLGRGTSLKPFSGSVKT